VIQDERHAAGRATRAAAFARLFEAVHEGVYIGILSSAGTETLAANPHLKLMFGYAPESADLDVRPFDPARFTDPQARAQFMDRLRTEGAVADHLLRLRRADGTPVWVELTARAESDGRSGRRVEALLRDVSER
jgi:PAS domain S-box-containing protein